MKRTVADLHVHSRFSNKPTYWALRKIRVPESYTQPEFIYRTAKEQGLDYVTITDHNCIQGALEIAHHSDAFISSELTVYFPEDGCKIHVVVLNITEAQFAELQQARKNVYDLVAYCRKDGITHFLAHPLYVQNDRLTAEHVEKLLLLFNTFEVRNGARARRFNRFIEQLLKQLTPTDMERLAEQHGLVPYGDEPWRKGFVGGSDDHSGLFIGRARTATRQVESLEDYLAGIRSGESWAEGENGDPLTLAHSIYGIGYSAYRDKFQTKKSTSAPFVKLLLNRFLSSAQEPLSWSDRVKLFVRHKMPERFQRPGNKSLTFDRLLDNEARVLVKNPEFLQQLTDKDRNRKIFSVTSHLANRMIFHYSQQLLQDTSSRGIPAMLNNLGAMGMVHMLAAPYYMAFHHQHRDKDLLQELDRRFEVISDSERREKIALFTDTLHDINGVAITIKRLIQTARKRGVQLTVITSTPEPTGYKDGVMNFQSIDDLVLPEYPELKLNFPPILNVLEYVEKEGFTRFHISTPGTIGGLGLLISRMLKIPADGTYHTEIPQYVRDLTNDEFLEKAAWQFMIWFYGQMTEVMVPSASTRQQLIENGLPEEKCKPLPRWVDIEQYRPDLRNPSIWKSFNLEEGTRFLYVGRVSKEKNLELLVNSFKALTDANTGAQLVIVGDGPYREEMEQKLAGEPVLFTGYKDGEELATLYASCDAFVFPSTTDTFGNVVLEAQSSGIPVIVTDQGGPKELMLNGKSGLMVPGDDAAALTGAMVKLLNEPASRKAMGKNARMFIEEGAEKQGPAYSTILGEHRRAANA